MKSFQFKDLMINVASIGGGAAFRGGGVTAGCGYNTLCYFTCAGATPCYQLTIPRVQTDEALARAGLFGLCNGPATVCFGLTGRCALYTGVHGCATATQELCINPSNACGGGTLIPCQAATCGATVGTTLTIQVDPEGVSAQLAAMKAELQQELAAIESQEKVVSEALRPQTATEVEELQGKLRDAIAELDERKKQLQKSEQQSKK